MIKSKYNLITEIDQNNWALFNPLSGAFDITDKEAIDRLEKLTPKNINEKLDWIERGYVFNSKNDEQAYFNKRYEEFINETNNNPTQFLLIPTYGCNFNCDYCYQKGIANYKLITKNLVNNFFTFLDKYRTENNKSFYVTLFGGEPLISNKDYEIFDYIIEKIIDKNIELVIVTNGYNLIDFLEKIKNVKIKELHITFDGDEEIHNKRRKTKDGKNSFERIIEGIKKSVEYKFPINIRFIIDKETIVTLPSLAEKFDKYGFLDLPKELFKTSPGRNYELINKYKNESILYTLDEMYKDWTDLMIKYPVLKKLHNPSYFGIKEMIENGEMYLPNFDSCPATKHEFVFDNNGEIYGCTASCGRDNYKIGEYNNDIIFFNDKIEDWKKRSILTIEECRDCSVSPICGGGCGVIANEKNGKVLSPNCKPIKQIMDIGIRYYKDVLLNK